MSRNRLLAVGLFVIGGLVLFSIGLFMIGNRRMLFSDDFEIFTEFSRVTGLQGGAKVRVAGMDAGEVEAIQVPARPDAKFRVRLRVREDLHPLVRLDSIAVVQTDGLVGNRYVQIEAGTASSPEAPPGATIAGREPFDMADLIEQASATVQTLDVAVKDLKGSIEQTLTSVRQTVDEARVLVADVGREARAITADGRQITGDVSEIVTGLREGKGTFGKMLNEDELYTRATRIAREAEQTMATARETVERARSVVAGLEREDGTLGTAAGEVRQTLSLAREAMADLADNAEALKHNFLFRGYFDRRGFYDLDNLSPDEYRAGAIGKDRVPLRVWLDASALFEPGKDGRESLSQEGRRRVDSAMAAFLRYPPTVPLVVEGYAAGPTFDAEFARARTRAGAVREYIVSQFGRRHATTATMPLGHRAEDSPNGDSRWDGIGLALWVPRDAFAAQVNGARHR
jgi:phospholipid/cholesterol/gamma-HCH transport system substrate-binding protein